MGRPDVLLPGRWRFKSLHTSSSGNSGLNPKLVIPTHYTQAADAATCDLVALDEFLALMDGTPVRRSNSDTINLKPADLPENGSAIQVLSYKFSARSARRLNGKVKGKGMNLPLLSPFLSH